jgi:Cytochrome bd terminal oxidase subunit I
MPALDPLTLSRIQFAWVIAWHILLPAFTVGIASYILLLEGLFLGTGRETYLGVSSFWTQALDGNGEGCVLIHRKAQQFYGGAGRPFVRLDPAMGGSAIVRWLSKMRSLRLI